jgi:galactokinase
MPEPYDSRVDAPAHASPAVARCVDAFARRFGGTPATVARAPGRVNLVGDHVDYADGIVLPIAIDRDCAVAVRRASDDRWRAWSEDLRSLVELPDPAAHASAPRLVGDRSWGNLVTGVLAGFAREGVAVPPLEVAVASDVPIGAGLASSAALGVALATAFADALSAPLFGIPLARIAQEAESQFMGVPCGMMDQVASALGRPDHALLIDCRTLDVRSVPFPPPSRAALWVLDPGVHRALADGRYAERRREVEEATRAAGVSSLRELDESALRERGLRDPLDRRARHVVRETQRAQSAANALRRDDLALFGLFMAQSHQSLRDDFAVSTPELDALVDAARSIGERGGVHGARLTGGGFGGCVIVLVEASAVGVPERIAAAFERRFRRRPTWMRVAAGPGAALVPPLRWRGA